jgi:hypothetical protein
VDLLEKVHRGSSQAYVEKRRFIMRRWSVTLLGIGMGSIAAALAGGCEVSCETDADNEIEDIVDEIGDDVEEGTEKVEEKVEEMDDSDEPAGY